MDPVTSCMNVLRRTPPSDTEQNLAGLCHLLSLSSNQNNHNTSASSLQEELLQRVDTPLSVGVDPQADGRPYLLCDHNRDGGAAYRSPWSNRYFPVSSSNVADEDLLLYPSRRLRAWEVQANEVYDVYRQLYYGDSNDDDGSSSSSVSSVYLWDDPGSSSNKNVFCGIWLLRKGLPQEQGYWNSIHVVEVGPVSLRQCAYRLTTTILLSVDHNLQDTRTNLCGSLTRQVDKSFAVATNTHTNEDDAGPEHLRHIGQMIEDTEHFMRCNMDHLYVQKTKEVLDNIRDSTSENEARRRPTCIVTPSNSAIGGRTNAHNMMLNAAIKKRQQQQVEE